jgi:hypothetical protein
MIRVGEWKPIKIHQMNLAYILKLTRRPSLLTRSRSHTYNKTIDLWNRVMNRNRNMKRCWQEYLRDWRQQSNQKAAQVLSHILPNTLRTYSRNNRLKTIKVRKSRSFWSGSSRTTPRRTSITNYTQKANLRGTKSQTRWTKSCRKNKNLDRRQMQKQHRAHKQISHRPDLECNQRTMDKGKNQRYKIRNLLHINWTVFYIWPRRSPSSLPLLIIRIKV